MLQNSGISGPQANTGAGGMITQQRPQFDDLELARHQNLLKIQQLRQTLEAAQQQEAQYKSQLEVNVSTYMRFCTINRKKFSTIISRIRNFNYL